MRLPCGGGPARVSGRGGGARVAEPRAGRALHGGRAGGRGATLPVCAALGQLVGRGTARGAEAGVDLSRQPAGLYLLRVMRADGRILIRKLLR